MKTKFLEAKWKIEKVVLRTIASIAVFGMVCFNDTIADALEDVMDAIGDFIYDYTALGHSEVQDIMAVTCLYMLVIGIDRLFTKVFPWAIKKLSTRHASRKKTEVSE